jgi:DeoR family transcriptional regulator of aga operon
MRDTSARRKKIIELLNENGSVQVQDLSNLFNISTVSIRKDLKFLDNRGVVTRTYGGAFLNSNNSETTESNIDLKEKLNVDSKCKIAQAAADMIGEGDSIILDSGTTTNKIAEQLHDKENITVITNDLSSINFISEYKDVELVVLGGTLRRKSMYFHGTQAEKTLKELHADKLFLGVDGFHMDKGITTHFEAEATLNRIMCNAATEVIVVADSSKFNKVCLYKIIEPSEVTTLITDSGISTEFKENLVNMGIEVIVVDQ